MPCAASIECSPGHILTPCSPAMGLDASCTQACDAQALGKPSDATSEWVWTTYGDDGLTIVENPTGGQDGKPNVGCIWRCREGFVQKTLDVGAQDWQQKIYLCA